MLSASATPLPWPFPPLLPLNLPPARPRRSSPTSGDRRPFQAHPQVALLDPPVAASLLEVGRAAWRTSATGEVYRQISFRSGRAANRTTTFREYAARRILGLAPLFMLSPSIGEVRLVAHYRNGDPLDLRRENLVAAGPDRNPAAVDPIPPGSTLDSRLDVLEARALLAAEAQRIARSLVAKPGRPGELSPEAVRELLNGVLFALREAYAPADPERPDTYVKLAELIHREALAGGPGFRKLSPTFVRLLLTGERCRVSGFDYAALAAFLPKARNRKTGEEAAIRAGDIAEYYRNTGGGGLRSSAEGTS